MTSPKTNTTILYIILLIVGLIQLISVTHQIVVEWQVDSAAKQSLLILRTAMWVTFLIIFSIKLKKIMTLKQGDKANL